MIKLNNFKPSQSTIISRLLVFGLLGFGLLLQSSTALAAEGYISYVTDSVEIPLRRGSGYKFKISRMLSSGTPVKILEANKKGWAQVEYRRGSKVYLGWMPSSVLQNQPVAKVRLQAQIAKTTLVEKKLNILQQELSTLKVHFDSVYAERASIKQENFECSKELTNLKKISGNAMELDQQNQKIKHKLAGLEEQNTMLKEQIYQSDDFVRRQWFLTGGAVLLLGLIIGRFFRIPSKRKKWGEI